MFSCSLVHLCSSRLQSCRFPLTSQMNTSQFTSALKQSREQLRETAESQGNSLELRMVVRPRSRTHVPYSCTSLIPTSVQDGVPLAPEHVKVVLEALDRSTAQFTAFQTVKDCLAEYLGTAAILPVSSGALTVRYLHLYCFYVSQGTRKRHFAHSFSWCSWKRRISSQQMRLMRLCKPYLTLYRTSSQQAFLLLSRSAG